MKRVVRHRDWYYRELFRFLVRLGVAKLEHGKAMKYYISPSHMGPRKV